MCPWLFQFGYDCAKAPAGVPLISRLFEKVGKTTTLGHSRYPLTHILHTCLYRYDQASLGVLARREGCEAAASGSHARGARAQSGAAAHSVRGRCLDDIALHCIAAECRAILI